jgi:hypothetical protein
VPLLPVMILNDRHGAPVLQDLWTTHTHVRLRPLQWFPERQEMDLGAGSSVTVSHPRDAVCYLAGTSPSGVLATRNAEKSVPVCVGVV